MLHYFCYDKTAKIIGGVKNILKICIYMLGDILLCCKAVRYVVSYGIEF